MAQRQVEAWRAPGYRRPGRPDTPLPDSTQPKHDQDEAPVPRVTVPPLTLQRVTAATSSQSSTYRIAGNTPPTPDFQFPPVSSTPGFQFPPVTSTPTSAMAGAGRGITTLSPVTRR